MSYEELIMEYIQLRDSYNALVNDLSVQDESEVSMDSPFDSDVESSIIFEEASPFFSSDENYQIIRDSIDSFKIKELKAALSSYSATHPDDSNILNAIISALNQYGDLDNLVCDIDSFTGHKNIYYNGYTGIDSEHYVYPHSSGPNYLLRLGFVRDSWLFAEDMILKRASEYVNDGIWFTGDSFDFERDTIDGGMIMEYKEEDLYDDDIDYLLRDMTEEMVVRFEADNEEKIDYTLTDEDKRALQTVAKYVKLRDLLYDIYSESDLYYQDITADGMVSGGAVSQDEYENPFSFDVRLADKYSLSDSYGNKEVHFVFDITNDYDKNIKDIQGIATFVDPYGKPIVKLNVEFAGTEISAGSTITRDDIYFECDYLNENHMVLYDTLYADLICVFNPEKIHFTNSTWEQF